MITEDRQALKLGIGCRRNRRMLVAAYWLAIAGATVAAVWFPMGNARGFLGLWIPVLFQLPGILGGVKRDGLVKPFKDPDPETVELLPLRHGEALDEREEHARDLSHYRAFAVCRWMGLALLVTSMYLAIEQPEQMVRLMPAFVFLLVALLWSLPQTILLWTEPDVEEAQ